MKKKLKKYYFNWNSCRFWKNKATNSSSTKDKEFMVTIFVTGMHMLEKYGETHIEVDKSGIKNIYKFINQNYLDRMDVILAKQYWDFQIM